MTNLTLLVTRSRGIVVATSTMFVVMMLVFSISPTSSFAQTKQIPDPQESMDKTKRDVHQLRPPHPTEVLLKKSKQAVQDGLDFLVDSQNEDGSWGSHDAKLAAWANLAFSVRKRGSHDAVRTACTAICAQALMETENRSKKQQAALDLAIKELIKPIKFAYEPGTSFNTWGYGYKLAFLIELSNAPEGKSLTEEIKTAGQSCIDGLKKYQQHTGGWSYYAGPMGNADNMSFNTSLFALSLERAGKLGCDIPQGMVKDAAAAVDRMRAPNGNFAYDSRFETNKNGSPLKMGLGGGARTMAATVAMFHLGKYEKDDLKIGMQVFDDGENYLESGRKLLQPHTAPHQISGYFFFFGYNYATAGAEVLGDDISQERWDRFSWTMLRTQEKDGKWWDTAWADYGEKWGTGFAVQTLHRYIRETERRMDQDGQQTPSESLKKAKDSIDKSGK